VPGVRRVSNGLPLTSLVSLVSTFQREALQGGLGSGGGHEVTGVARAAAPPVRLQACRPAWAWFGWLAHRRAAGRVSLSVQHSRVAHTDLPSAVGSQPQRLESRSMSRNLNPPAAPPAMRSIGGLVEWS
jgi:hypothetical protein